MKQLVLNPAVASRAAYTGAFTWAVIERASSGAVLRFDTKPFALWTLGGYPFAFKEVQIDSGSVTLLVGEAGEEYPGPNGQALNNAPIIPATYRPTGVSSYANGSTILNSRAFGLQHPASATKTVKIKRLVLTCVGGNGGGTMRVQLARGTGGTGAEGPWTGGGIATPASHDLGDSACECKMMQRGLDGAAVSISQGAGGPAETQIDTWAFTGGPGAVSTWDLYNSKSDTTEKPLTLRAGFSEGIGIWVLNSTLLTSQLDLFLSAELTEE
jgi:hypothetical protein